MLIRAANPTTCEDCVASSTRPCPGIMVPTGEHDRSYPPLPYVEAQHCASCLGYAPAQLTEDDRAVIELMRATYGGKRYRGRGEQLILAIVDRLTGGRP